MKLVFSAVLAALIFSTGWCLIAVQSPQADLSRPLKKNNGSVNNDSAVQSLTPTVVPRMSSTTTEISASPIVTHCMTTETHTQMLADSSPKTRNTKKYQIQNTKYQKSPAGFKITVSTTICMTPDAPDTVTETVITTSCTITEKSPTSTLEKNPTTSDQMQKQKSSATGKTRTTCTQPVNSKRTNKNTTTEKTTIICRTEGTSTNVHLLETPTTSTRDESKSTCTSKETTTISTQKRK